MSDFFKIFFFLAITFRLYDIVLTKNQLKVFYNKILRIEGDKYMHVK